MTPVPMNTKVLLGEPSSAIGPRTMASGVTDMRKGFASLVAQADEPLGGGRLRGADGTGGIRCASGAAVCAECQHDLQMVA